MLDMPVLLTASLAEFLKKRKICFEKMRFFTGI